MWLIKDKHAKAAPAPLLSFVGSDLSIAWSLFSTVKIPFPMSKEYLMDNSVKALADSLETISKWYVSPLIIHPNAIKPSKKSFCDNFSEKILIEGAISNAPGTCMILYSTEFD